MNVGDVMRTSNFATKKDDRGGCQITSAVPSC